MEELHLEVGSLKARISVQAELADMVKLNVGVDVDLDKVKLGVKGLDAQVLLKVKLDNVRAILEQALEAIDRDPGILDRLAGETDSKEREPGEDGRPRNGTGNVLEESASGGLGDGSVGANEAGRREATEAAEKKAREMGVDLAGVNGTGSGGRVLVRDVKEAAKNGA